MVLKAVSCDPFIFPPKVNHVSAAFPVSGMVTIPVSMYQTVVTNIQNMGDQGIPVTMSALTAATTDASQSSMNDQEMSESCNEEADVKVNGNQNTSVIEES